MFQLILAVLTKAAAILYLILYVAYKLWPLWLVLGAMYIISNRINITLLELLYAVLVLLGIYIVALLTIAWLQWLDDVIGD